MKTVLTSPITILLSIVLGVGLGMRMPELSLSLEGVGGIYLSLLKVTVLPFLFATILVGVVSLLQKEGAATLIKRILVGFLCSMLLAGAIGVGSVALTSQDMTAKKQPIWAHWSTTENQVPQTLSSPCASPCHNHRKSIP